MPSTVIASMQYDQGSSTLRIRFVSGIVYAYKNVPEKIYTAMKTSDAKGIYLNKYIKGHYSFEKIKIPFDDGHRGPQRNREPQSD